MSNPEDHVKKIREELDKLRGSRLPFVFAFLEEIAENQVSVDSVYGGNYDQGILMLVTLMTHLHQITGSSYFEIFFDMGSQLAASDIRKTEEDGQADLRDDDTGLRPKITEEELKDKIITLMKKKPDGKKPDK